MRKDPSRSKADITSTLEAFADTIVPGEKRYTDDPAIAGAAPGPGAVAAGALELLRNPATGVTDSLEEYARLLEGHARARYDRTLVELDFAERTALVAALLAPGHPERELWVLLALFCNMAFDAGAHLHTAEAVAAGHPGLAAMGFAQPDPDGLWRFPAFSYGRPLARIHPDTATSGSLA